MRRELKFFEDVAAKYGLELEAEEVSEGVRLYRELFFGTAESIERHKLDFITGLVVLWGTEKVRCPPASRSFLGFVLMLYSAISRLGGMLLRRARLKIWGRTQMEGR